MNDTDDIVNSDTVDRSNPFKAVASVPTVLTGSVHRLPSVPVQTYSGTVTGVELNTDKTGRQIYKLFVKEEGNQHHVVIEFLVTDARLQTAFAPLSLLPSHRRDDVIYKLTYHFDGKHNVSDSIENLCETGEALADFSTGPLALDGHEFKPDWSAAHKTYEDLLKLHPEIAKDKQLMNSQPTVDTARAEALKNAMISFTRQCDNAIVPKSVVLRDAIRHQVSNGVSWTEAPEHGLPYGELLMATKAFIESGAWKALDADGSYAAAAAITAGREENGVPVMDVDENGTPVIRTQDAPVPQPMANDSPNSEQAAPSPDYNALLAQFLQGGTVNQHNYQRFAVWPTDKGNAVCDGFIFSVTTYASDVTWEELQHAMKVFTAHPESIRSSCRVSVPNTPTQPAAPRPPAVNTPPMAGQPIPVAAPLPETAAKPIKTETGFALTRNSIDGKPGYTVSYMAGGKESDYPIKITAPQALRLLEETLIKEGYAVEQFVVGQRYPIAIRARWQDGKEFAAATATTKAKHYRDYLSFEVVKETVPTTSEVPF